MRLFALWLFFLLPMDIAVAADTTFKVGSTTRDIVPTGLYDWRGAKLRALHTTIWYPATADAREEAQWIGPPMFPIYSAGSAAPNAPIAARHRRSLIVLSHGFGGAATDLAWLGTALARVGFIVAAVDHPGTDSSATATTEGFALIWLRAVDLSQVIGGLLKDKTFGSEIDRSRIGAAGHSLGGYTVIVAAGGITEPSRIRAFCGSTAADALCTVPQNISNLRLQSGARLRSDPDFRQRYDAASKDYRDERIRAVLAMAPGLVPVFSPDSLRTITVPTAVVSGSADEITPLDSGAKALTSAIPKAALEVFPSAGHFVFFGVCTRIGRLFLAAVCRDSVGVDREVVHAETIRIALDLFTTALN